MNDPNIRTELDGDGILLATIDMPDRAMNVFSLDMMDSLEALLVRVESEDRIKAVVLTSGKASFLAGADLAMIKTFTELARTGSNEELHTLFGRLGRLFRRMEFIPKPFVAAINGLALGGGLELCLSCHQRIVSDDPDIQLGLPEIKLGLLPGAGGTQRLPRLVGVSKGLEMLLGGKTVAPAEALTLGLVSEVVAADQLIAVAKQRAKAMPQAQALWDTPGASFDSAPYDFSNRESAFDEIAKSLHIDSHTRKYYPAYHAIMDCVVGGWKLPMSEASAREMLSFVALMRDPVAGNMVRTLFLNRQKAAKAGLLKQGSALDQDETALIPQTRAAAKLAESLNLSEEERLLAVSLAALRVWASGQVTQAELADVAVVSAGISPAYSGGPFTYLKQHGSRKIAKDAAAASGKDAELFALASADLDRFVMTAT